MGDTSNIAWTKSTFNPHIGCTKVGPGCDGCYAEALDKRHRWGGATHWGAGVPRHRTSVSYWKQPLKWDKLAADEKWRADNGQITTPFAGRPGFWPVFCASLADVFDNEIPDQWRTDLFTLIGQTPHLSWLLVTKRIGNAAKMMADAMWAQKTWPQHWAANNGVIPNVRILITVVDQAEADRDIPKLLALPCKNGISYEPALGQIDWRPWFFFNTAAQPPDAPPRRRIDWIIVGGESSQGKHKARVFDVEWARSTIVQCKAAGVPVFVKQLGSVHRNEHGTWAPPYGTDRAGADPAEWPKDLRVREFPL